MNKHITKILTLILIVAFSLNLFSFAAFAETNSSAYILMSGANITQGNSAGKINVLYNITGMGVMDTIGVLWIDVFNSNGTLYTTIYGYTSNGLIKNNTIAHAGIYTINCVAGNSYYCEVTLIAAKNGGGDTRTIQTRTIVAPSSP